MPATEGHWNYEEKYSLTEQHQSHPIWCVNFNFIDPNHKDVFATCSGVRGSVYRCNANGAIDFLQAYVDPSADEEFFVCKWSQNEDTGAPLLLLAGQTGVIRVIDCNLRQVVWTAEGHGDAVNDIAVHPIRPSLFVTASRDHSLRLWNVKSQVCVCVMNGRAAHTNEVLSLDFHCSDGSRLLSSGMDHHIKIWNLADFGEHIEASFHQDGLQSETSFKAITGPSPEFTTHKVHWAYVDCVRWVGDLVLSKSVQNTIVLWEPDMSSRQARHKGYINCYQEFKLPDANIWFIRMSLSAHCNILACGNTQGQVYLWDLSALTAHPQAILSRSNTVKSGKARRPTSKSTVRQTAVSYDGSVVLAACEDGAIYRWDLVQPGDQIPQHDNGSGDHKTPSA